MGWAFVIGGLPSLVLIIIVVAHFLNRAREPVRTNQGGTSPIAYSRRRSISKYSMPPSNLDLDDGSRTVRAVSQEFMHRAAALCLAEESRESMTDMCIRHLTVSQVHEGDSWQEAPSHRWSSSRTTANTDVDDEPAARTSTINFIGRARAASQEVASTIRNAVMAPRQSHSSNSSRWSQRASRRSDNEKQLPPAAHSLVGAWRFVRDENYEGEAFTPALRICACDVHAKSID